MKKLLIGFCLLVAIAAQAQNTPSLLTQQINSKVRHMAANQERLAKVLDSLNLSMVNQTRIKTVGGVSLIGTGNVTVGSGTVTLFASGDLSPLFTTSVSNQTTTPAQTFSLSTAASHKFFGNATGSTGAPSYSSIGVGDLPSLPYWPFTGTGTLTGNMSIAAANNNITLGVFGSGVNNFSVNAEQITLTTNFTTGTKPVFGMSTTAISIFTGTTPASGDVLTASGVGSEVHWVTPSSGGSVTSVGITAPAAGITVSGSPITSSGSMTLALANDLAALEALSGTGIAVRTGTSTWANRTETGTANQITVTNGDGVSGNPTYSLSATLVPPGSVAAVGAVTGSNLSGTNTGDQTLNSLLPSQTGNIGKVLQTDGTNTSWATASGTVLNPFGQAVIYPGSDIKFFGTSITAGYGLAAVTSGYPAILAELYECTKTNNAVSASQWFTAVQGSYANTPLNNVSPAFVEDGFNDLRAGGNTSKTIEQIKSGARAFLASQFLATAVPANSGTVTTGGTWTTPTLAISRASLGLGGLIRQSIVSGSTLSWTFTGETLVIGTFSTDEVAVFGGDFTYAIDGGTAVTYTGKSKASGIADGNGNLMQIIPNAVIVTGLGATSHTVVVTTNSTSATRIDYFGTLRNPAYAAPVIMLSIPRMNAAGYAITGNVSDAIMQIGTDAQFSVADEFLAAGEPVFKVNLNSYYSVVTGVQGDDIHPNNVGNQQFATGSITAVLPGSRAFSSRLILDATGANKTYFSNGGGGSVWAQNRNPFTGVFDNTGAAHAQMNITTSSGVGKIDFYTGRVNNTTSSITNTFDEYGQLENNAANALGKAYFTNTAGSTNISYNYNPATNLFGNTGLPGAQIAMGGASNATNIYFFTSNANNTALSSTAILDEVGNFQANGGISSTTGILNLHNQQISESTILGGALTVTSVQNKVTNGRTTMVIKPNGTSTNVDFWLSKYSDVDTNYGYFDIGYEATSGSWAGLSLAGGTGVLSQIYFDATGGASVATANLILPTDGSLKAPSLAGSGTRMVVASSTGVLSTQTIPSGVPSLTSAHLFVGNGSNVATDVAITGDISITNAGVVTVNSVGASATVATPSAGYSGLGLVNGAFVQQELTAAAMGAMSTSAAGYINASGGTGKVLVGDNTWSANLSIANGAFSGTLTAATSNLGYITSTAGTSIQSATIGGAIYDHITDANNTSTTETDLYSDNTPANLLSTNKDKIVATFAGLFNDLTATCQLKVYFAGTVIGDTGALTVSSLTSDWQIEVLIIRTGTTTARSAVKIIAPGTGVSIYSKQTDLTSLTFTGANILKITGTAGGASGGSSDITAKLGTVNWFPAAP